jgi:hypothetical protein
MGLTDTELKKAYALAIMERTGDPYKIAFAMFPEDTAKAIEAASTWPKDAEVLAHQADIKRDPLATGALPDKYQAALKVLARADKCEDDEVFCKLMTLYCTIMSQIDKPGAGNTTNVIAISKVIMMPAPVSKLEWSQQATTQQRALTIEGERISARQ